MESQRSSSNRETLTGSPHLDAPLNTLHVDRCAPIHRLHALLYAAAILGLVYHRLTSILASFTFAEGWMLLADLVLAFMWGCSRAFKWRPVHRREFPDRLPECDAWPKLDVFVCTADPKKEPPVGVVSTALSFSAAQLKKKEVQPKGSKRKKSWIDKLRKGKRKATKSAVPSKKGAKQQKKKDGAHPHVQAEDDSSNKETNFGMHEYSAIGTFTRLLTSAACDEGNIYDEDLF